MKKIIFDLKFLIGIIFCYFGLVLLIYGLFTNKQVDLFPYNINLLWGIVTFLFGLAFLVISLIIHKNPRPQNN